MAIPARLVEEVLEFFHIGDFAVELVVLGRLSGRLVHEVVGELGASGVAGVVPGASGFGSSCRAAFGGR